MNAPNLESLFEHFDYEIDNVCSKLALLDYYNEHDREECIQLNSSLGNIQYIIHETNKLIENAFEELEEKKKRCQQLYELLEDQADYIVNNIPSNFHLFIYFSSKVIKIFCPSSINKTNECKKSYLYES